MRWLLLVLQWLYPLVLLLAATSRASLPSFVYLLACFVFAWCPPLRQLVAPAAVRPGDQTAIGPGTPGLTSATPIRPRHQKSKSNAFTLSASSSFMSASTVGTSHTGTLVPSVAAPFQSTSTWQVHRSFFISLCVISGVTLLAQLIVHALYWADAWRPDGQWDGHTRVEQSPALLLQVLELFQLAPWASARDGVHSLLPDVAMLAVSIFAVVLVRLDGSGRIRWVRRAYCCGDSADELSGLGRGSPTRSQVTGSGSALSAAVLLLHFFICMSLFSVAILQPSLLSLPYFIVLAALILAQVLCERPEGGGSGGGNNAPSGARDSELGFFQQLLFVQGSSVQYGALGISTVYLYAHLAIIHLFQFSIILQHIDRSSDWLGLLGLFIVDVTAWSDVIVIQWAFLVALVCCLIAVSLKRLSLQTVAPFVLTLSSFDRRTLPSQQAQPRAQAALGEMISPVSPFLVSPPVPRQSTLQRESEELKQSAPLQLHASFAAMESASPSPPSVSGFSIRRSLFAQSSFELKSFVDRSFRNHGLLLICALVLVQVMMVHDIFNVVNVGLLLTCMSIANVPRARPLLTALLHFQVLFMIASSFVKFLFYIPFLLATPRPADYDSAATRQTIEEAFGLIKHVDGFTPTDRTQGSFVFLYLLNSVLPSVLIAVYLIVHRASATHLTVLNLFNVASTGDTVLLQRFIDTSPEMLSVRDRTHKTVLHVAASNGHLATVRLIMNYVDVNAQDKHGNTALHYAYKYGFDSVVHLLLSSGSKGNLQSGRGRQSLNLINSELANKKGLTPAEMKQRWFTKVMRRVRSIIIVIEGFFYLHASKLTLLLLFIVASQSINLLHMLYFIFFLLFFSMETVAQRLWNVLVAYCAVVFFVLYTFSVVEPLYSLRTREVNEGTDWIRYLGLFSVRDSAPGQRDQLSQWWSNLLIYYGAYVLAVMQKMVYRRGEELGMIQSTQQSPRSGGGFFTDADDEHGLDRHLRDHTARRPSRLTRVSIVMLTYLALLIVAMIDVSLFHLGYLVILLLSLAVHQWAAQAGRVLSAFWFLCIVYTAAVLFAQYAYLLPEFRRWLTRHFNWHRFSLYDIGFRSPSNQTNHNGGSVDDEFSSDSILLILLPPTACFVMCAYYLKTLWRELRGKAAMKEQGAVNKLAGAVAARAPAHVSSRDTAAAVEEAGPPPAGGLAARRKQFGTMRPSRSPPTLSILPRHRRTSSSPPAEGVSPSWLAEVHEVASPHVPEAAATTAIDIAPSPSGRASSGLPKSASMLDFSLLTATQRAHVYTYLYAAYLFCVNVLAHQATQLLVLFILLYVLLIDPLSLLNFVYLLLLLFWLPFDGRSLDNSLWLPLTVYSIPLITAKYLFQFPSLVSAETDLSKWIGFRDFHGHLIRNLIGDLVILAIATLQRVATKTMRKMLSEKKRVQQLQQFRGVAPTNGSDTAASAPQRQLSPLEQQRQREQTAMAIEAERLRKQHELLDTLAEEDESTGAEAASPLAYGVRSYQQEEPLSAGARQSESVWTEEKKSAPAASSNKPVTRNVHASPSPSPSPSEEDRAPSSAAKPHLSRSELSLAVARELWVHMLDVLASFYRHYGLEIFLLFLLLMSYARSNALSLVYVLFFCGCWIQFGGRSVLVRSRVLCWSLLSLLAVSIIWQYALLLGMPPGWRSSHEYWWADWDGVVQQWLLLGHFTTRDLMWDCWSFVFLAWFMPYWREEREALAAEGRLHGDSCWPCARDPESASASPIDRSVVTSAAPSGASTPHRLHRTLLRSDQKQIDSEAQRKEVDFGHMYVPPSVEPVQLEKPAVEVDDSDARRDSHALNLLKSSETRASRDPRVRRLWPKVLFYSGLVIDKLLFVFIFFIGTSHNNLFSCVYLVFSCWYLLQNYLFDLEPTHFRAMWRTLRKWNFAILVCLVLYQIPWVPYLFLSDATLRWEMFIGLHKFVRPPTESRYDTPAYMRVYTNPLGDRGALPQIFIFLLIEAQLLLIESRVFRSGVLGYFRDMRRMSTVRCAASTLLYKEWLVQRIKTILLFREKLEANFTYIFLEASKLNGDYFQDEMVWPQPKPAGWDERVNNLLLEDSLKAFEFNKDKERKSQEAAGLAPPPESAKQAQGSATNQEAGEVFSGATTTGVPRTPGTPSTTAAATTAALPTATRPLPSSSRRTLTDSETDGSGQQGIMSAFRGTLQGPLQISAEEAEEEEESDSPGPLPPPTGSHRAAKERRASGAAEAGESVKKPSTAKHPAASSKVEKAPKTLFARLVRWLKKPLLRHIDSVFWTEYALDPSTRELVVVAVPDVHTLNFGQAVWRCALSNTQWLCFFFFFINLLVNGNLLSMVVPVLILSFAIFERPRAPRGFWLFALLWSSIVVSAKFVFQLYIFCAAIDTSGGTAGAVQLERKYIFAPSPYCVGPSSSSGYSVDALLGLRKLNTHTYFTIILIDIVCMLSIVLHRTVMMARGLWDTNEEEELAKQERRRRIDEERAAAEEQEASAEADADADKAAEVVKGTVAGAKPAQSTGPKLRASRPSVLDGIEAEVKRRATIDIEKLTATPMSPHHRHISSTGELSASASELQMTLWLLQREEEQQEEDARATRLKEKTTLTIMGKLRRLLTRWWFKFAPLELQYYYADLMPRERFHYVNVHRPGYDFYIYIFFIELVAAIWILICYDNMASTSLNTVSTSLSTNLFSGNMVVTLFVQILIIILDRVCYLFRSILSKLLLQYATLLYWFIKLFFQWPVSSQAAFTANGFLQFFFVLKLLYFVCSGLQLHAGFPPLETAGFQYLTRYPGVYHVYAYKVYRAIPFVFELRTMLDWMCAVSSLDLWDCLKLEEIHGGLYSAQCDILYRRMHQRGTPRALIEKFCSGVLLFLLLLLIIFGPLLLFSTANPVSQNNPVVSASISLSLSGRQGEYPLVDISSYVLQPISSDYFVALQNEDLLQDSDRADAIQSVQMAPYSDHVWDISPPSLAQLMHNLNDQTQPMAVKFQYSFSRSSGPQNDKTISNVGVVTLDQKTQQQLARILNQTLSEQPSDSSGGGDVQLRSFDFRSPPVDSRFNASHPFTGTRPGAVGAPLTPFHGVRPFNAVSSVRVPGVVPVFLRLPATSDPIEINGARNRSDILLTLDVAQIRWWFVNMTDGTRESNIHFVTVSNRIFAGPLSNLSYSIVSVYVAILFTIGQFVRLLFGNQVPAIPYVDLPNANKLIMIVEGIYIARQKKQLAKEEILYRRLLKIYRTPALLLFLTAREDTDEEKRIADGPPPPPTTPPPSDAAHAHAASQPATANNGLRARRPRASTTTDATHETKSRR